MVLEEQAAKGSQYNLVVSGLWSRFLTFKIKYENPLQICPRKLLREGKCFMIFFTSYSLETAPTTS